VTLAVIAVFGGLTLVLHDDTFIKWKPTLVYWILAGLMFGSQWFGNKTLIERMISGQIALPEFVWRRLNLSWGIFFAALGAANIYVAFYYGLDLSAEVRRNIWVDFKVFGSFGLTLVFAVAQALFMARYITETPESAKPGADRTTD